MARSPDVDDRTSFPTLFVLIAARTAAGALAPLQVGRSALEANLAQLLSGSNAREAEFILATSYKLGDAKWVSATDQMLGVTSRR